MYTSQKNTMTCILGSLYLGTKVCGGAARNVFKESINAVGECELFDPDFSGLQRKGNLLK